MRASVREGCASPVNTPFRGIAGLGLAQAPAPHPVTLSVVPYGRTLVICVKVRLDRWSRRNQKLKLVAVGVVQRPWRCVLRIRVPRLPELRPVANNGAKRWFLAR